jgi:hypothetical protein
VAAAREHAAFAAEFFTGMDPSGNRGWILSANDKSPTNTPSTFASSYLYPPLTDTGRDWDYCNGVHVRDANPAPIARLYYR